MGLPEAIPKKRSYPSAKAAILRQMEVTVCLDPRSLRSVYLKACFFLDPSVDPFLVFMSTCYFPKLRQVWGHLNYHLITKDVASDYL